LTLVLATGCGDGGKSSTDTSPDATGDIATPSDVLDGDTTASSDGDTTAPVEANGIFAFRAAPGQSISEGPFPSDGLLGPDGTIELAPLGADPRFAALAKAPILLRTDLELGAKRAFGFISAAFFPMNAAPDLASFEGAVHYIALSGPEQGAVFPGTAHWFSHADYLSVFPAWGHYLVPGAKYGIVIDSGVKAQDGRTIAAPPAFEQMIAAEVGDVSAEVASARLAFADLRGWLADKDPALVGTVFTTEATMPFASDLLDAVDAFPLVAPTSNVRLAADHVTWLGAGAVAGSDLDDYFGLPAAPFLTTPTPWYAGARANAAQLPGGSAYTGGSFRGAVAYIVNGSFVAPSFNAEVAPDGRVTASPIRYQDGAPKARTRAVVPFTAFFCASHLTDGAPDPNKTVPVAIFTHGGTAQRSDALPFAVANCAAGYATIAADLPFHSGRQETLYLPAEDLIAPLTADTLNVFSGKREGEPGFVPDQLGDNGGATTSVGGMFGLPSNFDPDVIEANLITISLEAHTLARYLKDGGSNGLGAFLGTKLDTSHLVMESLSFGTSFTTALMAARNDFVGAVQSVGSSGIIGINLPMAPNNAMLAGGIIRTIYGLASTQAEVNASAQDDPMIGMLQWLSQRGDPAGYAPFVLRHRRDAHVLHVFGSGDSWDETLFSPAQLSFNDAWGVPVFTNGADWTLDAAIPGSDTALGTAFTAPITNNLTYGDRTQTAAFFYNAASCHAQVVTPICESGFAPPYPPNTPRPAPLISVSPLCALQASVIPFLAKLVLGETPSIVAPSGDCDALYAP